MTHPVSPGVHCLRHFLLNFPVLHLHHLILVQVPCLHDDAATAFDLANLFSKFVLLLFQPVDFGYIGPTELELLDNLALDCEVRAPTIF